MLVAAPFAVAAPPKVALTVAVKGSGKVSGAPGRAVCPPACRTLVVRGAAVRLAARPAAGWRFGSWSGACKGTVPTCTLRLTGAARVVATFARIPAPPAPPPPSGFTPAFIAGTWTGSWKNQTFGSTGSASFVVKQPSPSSFTFAVTLGGNVFGCAAPPPTSGEVTQGTGPNHWNADGFSIQTATGGGGSASVAYDFKANALTGSGTSGCNPGITWTIKGSFTGNTFAGTVSITLPGGLSATSILSLTRG